VKATSMPVIFKVNTPRIYAVRKLLCKQQMNCLKVKILPRSKYSNPMSFEFYVKLSMGRTPFVKTLREAEFNAHMEETLAHWENFRGYVGYMRMIKELPPLLPLEKHVEPEAEQKNRKGGAC